MISSKVKESVKWYFKNKVICEALAKKVESIVKEILESENINYYSVSSRAKSVESYREKALKGKYKDPRSGIMDMAGIRVITYTNSDAKKVHELVKDAFDIHPKHSIDKAKELGTDRVGYRSIHCVGTLGRKRLALPEHKIFKGFCFEIQIRTILQHAWAEFEHDKNYKFSGVLPKNIRRRLSLLAGNLELIDKEFDELSKNIDVYAQDIRRRTEIGDLDVPIDSTSLSEYMKRKFRTLIISKGIAPRLARDETIIEEIKDMGINTLQELDKIIPQNYIEIRSKYIPRYLIGMGVLDTIIIDLLIIHDVDKYFEKAWKGHWHGTDKSDVPFFKHFGIDFKKYTRKYDLDLFDESFYV